MTKQEQAWQKLKEYVEQHPYTTITVEFKAGAPFTVIEIKESIKLT